MFSLAVLPLAMFLQILSFTQEIRCVLAALFIIGVGEWLNKLNILSLECSVAVKTLHVGRERAVGCIIECQNQEQVYTICAYFEKVV